MTIIIAGGSGFLGQELSKWFRRKGHTVYILTRTPKYRDDHYWDARNTGPWQQLLEHGDVLINMTGKSVDCRYTEANKKAILLSRLESTAVLQQAVDQCSNPPKVWLNASSATIYVHAETQQMTEATGITGDDFSMGICTQWEAAFFARNHPQTRKVALRTSIVLGNEGGAFPKFRQITRLGLGGVQGRGQQMMSWIHIDDFCAAVAFLIDQVHISGPVNITAPNPVRNREFMQQLRRHCKMPFGLPAPAYLLEMAAAVIGTETELMLKSRNVVPERLLQEGFTFQYPEIDDALEQLIP